jgi:prephenate dehydrogenase
LAIVGVGLIGGSIGLAARRRGLAKQVVGIGRRRSSLQIAKQIGAVTRTTTRIAAGVADADLVVVCTPVDKIADHVCEVAAHCDFRTLITDAGSTKADLVRDIESRVAKKTRFVGSHPLAGAHQAGPRAAREDLFEGRMVVVTPTQRSVAADVTAIQRFWRQLGANVTTMSVKEHDAALAATSHLPHIVAAALASVTPVEALGLVAGGWCDSTRIAAAKPELWVPILQQNRAHTLKALDKFAKVLASFRRALNDDDSARLQQLLEAGKQNRDVVGD